tara:strand:- start:2027 stop:2419 length:393 start_codon:yes stop_codon:yes gene_type:complete
MTLTEILEHLEEFGEEALLMEPRSDYDDCILGVGYRFHDGPLAIYSVERVLAVLQKDEMDEEDAIEWFDFNVIGGWNGPGTPIYVRECEMRTDVVESMTASHGFQIAKARLGCAWPEGDDGEDQGEGVAT